ncbi:HK97 gp10 family phage protein [Streptomyces sp. NBC_00414]|uniref:HK97 gp10 family phage protein n=1 Tax=Streptomyces sp. NBC_00414 TaxID=2975739 RepID=UPI002E21F58E
MPKNYRLRVNPGWPKHVEEAGHDFLTRIAREIHRDMVRYAPVETGRLRNDLDWEVNGLEARIGARTLKYAIFVEEGTSPHPIKAKAGGALNWEGAQHPVNEVNHPGSRAQWFMRRALYQKR